MPLHPYTNDDRGLSCGGWRPRSSFMSGAGRSGAGRQPIAMRGWAEGWTQPMNLSIVARGTETQPAVAPLPLTCRKIPAPRPGTAGQRLKLITSALAYCVG